MNAHIFYDTAEFARLNQLFAASPEIFRKAVRSALRRAGKNMATNVKKGVKGASFLKARDIVSAIGKLHLTDDEAMLTVRGAQLAGHKLRLVPSRITARKGKPSRAWPAPKVQIGPGEAPKEPQKAGFSRPFVARVNGLKAMYWREKATGRLKMPRIVSPQYFAAFDKVKEPVLNEAEATFLKRLEHEIDYRLGLR